MTATKDRMRWLDGVRGGAALFVVLHHIWLATWPYFPENRGPSWVGFLLYGHFAVAVFIVVSGFSLSIAPLRHSGSLVGGSRRFIRRRAWRILPAYWAALIGSTAILVLFLQPNVGAQPLARSFVIHGLLLQDVFGQIQINGTFWSIAVEWQIYFLFPLILILARWRGIVTAVTATALVVIGAHILAGFGSTLAKIDHLSPQFLLLFALGVLAAWIAHGQGPRISPRWTAATGLSAAVAVVVLALSKGSVWTSEHWFWADLIAGLAVACGLLFAARSTGRWREATLGSRAAVFLGGFSYSMYLFHAPLLGLALKYIVNPLGLSGLPEFAFLLAAVLPLILVGCYAFFAVFEGPFLARRDFKSLRTLPAVAFAARLVPGRRTAPLVKEPA